jgi:nicotinate-nucleotide adenylyltransferase
VKVGLFGGSFDPVHRGHIATIQEARRLLGIQQVIFLPTAQPPHKAGRLLAPPLARYAMVELALLREEGLVVSPHELTLGRPAYTAETLEHFRRELPEGELFLFLGSDSFLDLPHWVRWRDIAAAARLVVLGRPGWELDDALSGASASAGDLAALVRDGRVEVPRITASAISSTRLREMLAHGERPPDGWLPELVVEFIDKYHLYR